MRMKYISLTPGGSSGPLRKLVALVMTFVVAGLALMFSAVFLAVIAIVGVLAWAYLWWKTRHMRKMMRDLSERGVAQEAKASNDDVFEGEVIRVVEPRDVR